MKKTLKSALIIILAILMISPNAVFAAGNIYDEAQAESSAPRVTGLIDTYGFVPEKKSAGVLRLYCEITCIMSVDKCGYENAVIQRRPQSSAVWSNYIDLGDYYVNDFTYHATTTYNVASGYFYRVTSDFYAKKNILTVERIRDITSSAVLI